MILFLASRRKSRAKRARESRKATQPVPQNLMDQLKKGIFDQESEEDGETTAKVCVGREVGGGGEGGDIVDSRYSQTQCASIIRWSPGINLYRCANWSIPWWGEHR